MPTVLRVIARLNMGGPARHVVRIHAPLAARGFRTVLVTGAVERDEPDLLPEARAAGIDVRCVPSLGRALRPGSDLLAWRALRRLAVEVRPDIVHTHTAKAGLLGRLAAGAPSRRPLVVHSYHGHVLSGTFGPVASAVFATLERRLARITDRIVAVAPGVRDELLTRFGVGRAEQYAIIPPGIDRERTARDVAGGRALREQLGVAPDTLLVGYVGRFEPVKDVTRLLAAWERLGPTGARGAERLLLMGAGRCTESLRRQARGRDDVLWLPPRAALGDVYAALDVLVLPSRAEGLPQVLVEALTAGVPVIASAVGGVPDLVRHEGDGLLVPPRDVPSLAVAMARVLREQGLRTRLADGAARRRFPEMTADAVAEALAALYTAGLAARAARPAR